MKNSICGLNLEELRAWMEKNGEKPFRAAQIFRWIYQGKAFQFDQMKNLGGVLQEKLSKAFTFPTIQLVSKQVSEDQETIKFLWQLEDGKRVESVLILSGTRRTVCISCQVGCPARCAFCASGKQGLIRQLSTGEIVEQVLFIQRFLSQEDERVSHIVFMGMGEPLENYDAVIKTIELLNAEETFHISQRRITVSTVGVVPNILRLAKEKWKVNLVLSLHAPTQEKRKKIIPYARKYPLEEILDAMEEYGMTTKRDITYEYTLMEGINDSEEDALKLAVMLKGKQCTVNLIPYNPVEGLRLKRPSKESIEAFRDTLESEGISTTWRYTKGKDIAAACGQLALPTPSL